MPKSPLFVVPVDFAPEMEATVSGAFALAKRCGTQVHLLEVVAPRARSVLEDTPLDSRTRANQDRARLERSIQAAERAHIQVRTVAHRGDATSVILSYVQLTKARLVVIAQHYGASRWRRSTRIATTVSRAAPAPVLVVPPPLSAEKNSLAPFTHIVSAVDFTIASAVAVRTVLDLIRRSGARLTLVHAVKHDPHHMVLSGGDARRVMTHLRGRGTQASEWLRRKIPADVRIRVDARVTTGHPHVGILDTASEVDADLIVMGVPPRSRLDEVLFGSTLRHVLRRATVPVLVLPVLAGAHKWSGEIDRGARETGAGPRPR